MAVYTVSQVAEYLRDSLEGDRFLADLWVSGEVSNLSRSAAGHLYFTIKDSESQLRCVMFRPTREADRLWDGTSVIVHGRISIYPVRGELQIYVDLVQPAGTGELHLRLERLKARLEEEGLFEPTRKRNLPPFPNKIGVVTSPSGAVLHDIATVVQRRYPLAELVVSPTSVQGEQAALDIADALNELNRLQEIDVIIVARGGGSLEELWAFNEEIVARAIYVSHAPVVSAVGHETDITIADLVADLRAPTPSAAAEMAVPDMSRLLGQVKEWQHDILAIAKRLSFEKRRDVDSLVQRLSSRGPQVGDKQQRLDELTQSLSKSLWVTLNLSRERFQGLEQQLRALDPTSVLERGYAIVQRSDQGALVKSVGQVEKDDELNVRVSDGSFNARVS